MTGIEIVKAVAAQHLLTVDQLRSRCRLPLYVRARKSAARKLKQDRALSNGQIAVLLHRTPWAVWSYFNEATKKNGRKRAGA